MTITDLGAQLEAAWAAEISGRGDLDALVASTGEIAEQIAGTKATSFHDLLVKGRALLWCYDGNSEEMSHDLFDANILSKGTTDRLLLQSIVGDLTGDHPAGAA